MQTKTELSLNPKLSKFNGVRENAREAAKFVTKLNLT
jgi:hypothetical protein